MGGLRVLHVTPSFYPAARYGGPIESVKRLCQSVQAAGTDVEVATTSADGPNELDVDTRAWSQVEGLRVRYFRRSLRSGFGLSADLASFLAKETARYDLLHITACFSFSSLAAGHFARRAGVPYVVSPRGSLQPWSLAQKRWKKAPYWWLFERRQLESANAIHATAERERDEVSRLLPNASVIVVPNGVDLGPPLTVERRPNRVVFLGRLHRVKGLDTLAEAMRQLTIERPEIEAVLAGPDDTGEWARVRAIVDGMTPRPRFNWVGSLEGSAKFDLLGSARVFVLPSHTENFGQVVVEALACGTPVVVSRGCPWESVEQAGAGYWVENNPEEVARGLRNVLDAGSRYVAMQAAARDLAARFAWDAQGTAMANHYRRLVKGPL